MVLLSQVESHPYFRNAALVSFCKLHGIHVTAYAPLGSPDSAAIMGRSSNTPGPMQVGHARWECSNNYVIYTWIMYDNDHRVKT
jgi:diketogulonate reductase-like aldo/keto reductase